MAIMRALLLVLVVALTFGCDATSTPRPAPVLPRSPPEPPLFEFHSSFWVNLHQRLHYSATGRRPPPPGALQAPSAPEWAAGVEFYKQRFGERGGMGIILDPELVALNRRLSALGSSPDLAGVDPALASQLEALAPIARSDWQEQDRANRAWISALEPAIRRHGEALQAALTATFQAPWPSSPIRVDVSGFAGPFGAYTVLNPVHITISSANPAYAGDAALEMIFHEASHALIEPIEKKLEAEAARRGRRPPDDLWHALIFYSTGEIVKRRLGPGYVPYATKNGLWARGWSDLEAALRRDWQPYLDGTVDVDRAIAALIEDLTADSPPAPATEPTGARPSGARRPRPEGLLASPAY